MSAHSEYYSPITHSYSKPKVIRAKALRRMLTAAERRLWHALRMDQLRGLHFRRQQAISGFIADFYCHRLRLVIELDGAVHDQTTEYDAERDQALANLGMTVLRFKNEQVFHSLDHVLQQITQAAHTQAPTHPAP